MQPDVPSLSKQSLQVLYKGPKQPMHPVLTGLGIHDPTQLANTPAQSHQSQP